MALKKKKLIMILVPLLLIGGGAGAYFGGLIGGKKAPKHAVEASAEHGEEAKEEEHGAEKADAGDHGGGGEKEGEHGGGSDSKFVFYTLPDIVVNLSNPGRKSTYLKIKINLELADKAQIKTVEAVLPRIVDNLQIYLRELKIEDIQGSEGLYRLREELLHRVAMAAEPAEVKDVLFAEMLMQ